MSILAELVDHVIGVDPDRDRFSVAAVEALSKGEIGHECFAATSGGYLAALDWADDHTVSGRRVWAIEGAGSWGSGLCRVLRDAGEWMIEFSFPLGRPSQRRRSRRGRHNGGSSNRFAFDLAKMNHRRATERAPGDQRWCATMIIDDHLPPIQKGDRIRTSLVVEFHSDDRAVFGPIDTRRADKARVIHGQDVISGKDRPEPHRNALAARHRVVDRRPVCWCRRCHRARQIHRPGTSAGSQNDTAN